MSTGKNIYHGIAGSDSTQNQPAEDSVVCVRLRPLPSLLIGVVQTAIRVCNQTEYRVRGSCKFCGGTLSGYDTRLRRFAILFGDKRDEKIEVTLHRSYCRICGRIWTPQGPFYPNIRTGSPVVDLCRSLSQTMPPGRAATRLGEMGVQVDRWSVHSYCCVPFSPPPTLHIFGMNIPVSIIALSSLSETKDHEGRISGEDVLAACLYPSSGRASS